MKQTQCKLCAAPFVCDNGMWSTTCTCARDRPRELVAAQSVKSRPAWIDAAAKECAVIAGGSEHLFVQIIDRHYGGAKQ